MVICAAFGCSNKPGTAPDGVSFHTFPKNEACRLEWILYVARKDWQPSSSSVLCSRHFQKECFRLIHDRARLHRGAVPTIFPGMPVHLQEINQKHRRPPPKPRSDAWEKMIAEGHIRREQARTDARAQEQARRTAVKHDHGSYTVESPDVWKRKADLHLAELANAYRRCKCDQNRLTRLTRTVRNMKVCVFLRKKERKKP